MNITIHHSFLPHTDPDAALTFYRDALGFEVRADVGYADMRWITVGPANQPDTSIVLQPPSSDPGMTEEERQTILGSRKAQSRTPYGWSVGSWTTSAPLASSLAKVLSRSSVARMTPK